MNLSIITNKHFQGQRVNGGMNYNDHEGTLAMFDILIVMMALWVYACAKIHYLYILTYEL